MRILYLKWNSLAENHMVNAYINSGYELDFFDFLPYKDLKVDEAGSKELVSVLLGRSYDYVFSFNYFPVAAVSCMAAKVKYVSWTFDSPYAFLYSDTITFPTNYAFVFDKAEYNNLVSKGINTVYYLPMAAPAGYYEGIVPSEEDTMKYSCDISMIGSMYSEPKHRLFDKFDRLSDFARGYLDSLITAQSPVYGVDIMEPALTDTILEELMRDAPLLLPEDEMQSPEWVYSKYFLSRELTRRERYKFLTALSGVDKYNIKIYTNKSAESGNSLHFCDTLDYYSEMPLAFKCSKINLNITLRSIISGIPLRCFDIIGCGGFLLTNYQDDFNDFFIAGEDYVYYDSLSDLMNKAEYYLSHDKERKEIAQNGYINVRNNHTYEARIKLINNIVL